MGQRAPVAEEAVESSTGELRGGEGPTYDPEPDLIWVPMTEKIQIGQERIVTAGVQKNRALFPESLHPELAHLREEEKK